MHHHAEILEAMLDESADAAAMAAAERDEADIAKDFHQIGVHLYGCICFYAVPARLGLVPSYIGNSAELGRAALVTQCWNSASIFCPSVVVQAPP